MTYTRWTVFIVAFCAPVLIAQTPVPLRIEEDCTWVQLPPARLELEGTPVVTHGAVELWHVVDPDTGEPYGPGWPFDCPPERVRHEFRLDKLTFLLGEPILVEYRVSVEGLGSYEESVGGNYRSRDRDDNFLFLLRREDGSWLRDVDPYPGFEGGGGLSSLHTAASDKPLSLWNAVQRWVAIEEPGRYDLYCFYSLPRTQAFGREEAERAQLPADAFNALHAKQSGTSDAPSAYAIERHYSRAPRTNSPLLASMPQPVTALLEEFTLPLPVEVSTPWTEREVLDHIRHALAFAHFSITIERGTAEQTNAMVVQCTERATAALSAEHWLGTPDLAILDGVNYCLQPWFLPTLREWLSSADVHVRNGAEEDAIALNPSPDAAAMLLAIDRADPEQYVYRLNPYRNSQVVAPIIELLTSDDTLVAQRALAVLHSATRAYFFGDADGMPLEKLTPDQMQEVQALWRAWWTRNGALFKPAPVTRAGFIDPHGSVVIPPQFTHARPFKNGLAAVTFNNEMRPSTQFFIDTAGQRVAYVEPWGEAPIRPIKIGDAWGYENAQGEVVVPAQYETASRFSDGLALVRKNGKHGYINTRGEVAIALLYDEAKPFAHGQAAVTRDLRAGIIDINGDYVLETEYSSVGPIVEDRVAFRLGNKSGFLDSAGKVVVEPKYSQVHDFEDGLARVETYTTFFRQDGSGGEERLSGFIDRDGVAVVPIEYHDARDFEEGLAAVLVVQDRSRLWGYVDRTGAMVIPPQFADAYAFSEGLAAVSFSKERGGKWGFIDKTGAVAIQPQFEWVGSFSEGLAAVRVVTPYQALDPDKYRSSAAAP